MITIKVSGGLGNQLFKIFTLISLSLDRKIPFYFAYQKHQKQSHRHGGRPCRPFYWDTFLQKLRQFVQKEKVYYIEEKNYPYDHIFSWSVFLRNLHRFVQKNPRVGFILKESYSHYSPIPTFDRDKHMLLKGYFQSYKYFRHNENIIYNMIDLASHRRNVASKFVPGHFNHQVSLHLRIGDYKNTKLLLPLTYYVQALQQLIQDTQKKDWKIMYFCEAQDEHDACRVVSALEEKFPACVFEPVNQELHDWEQMLCMTLCQHNIIANSTFSWWGAYMNEHDNKVYYPSVYRWPDSTLKKNIEDDMFLEHWKEIDV